MKIKINNYRPLVNLFLHTPSGKYKSQKFLVNTGFTGSIIFSIGNKEILSNLHLHDLSELDKSKNQGVEVADGRIIKTFLAKIIIKVDDKIEKTDVLIMDSDNDDYPIIGIDFLMQNKKKLNLDFVNEVFEIA